MFLGVALSITAFPVLARILAELKLLTTHVGQTAVAAAAFNDVAACILLALAVALAGNSSGGGTKSPSISIWYRSPDHDSVMDEACICLTLAGVMISGFMTDLLGIYSIFDAFVYGLTIPKGGEFAAKLKERIEDFVAGLLLPLYNASSGEDFGDVCSGHAVYDPRERVVGIWRSKGLVGHIVLNIRREKKGTVSSTVQKFPMMKYLRFSPDGSLHHFHHNSSSHGHQLVQELDQFALAEFRSNESIQCEERVESNVAEEVLRIAQSRGVRDSSRRKGAAPITYGINRELYVQRVKSWELWQIF
ncbi:Monovalent cation:proton antiporter-like protein [Theobroma cacao]|uniref:Monovalent cation:proton antiporter-like protein n=1 Tax=Theobroma cacao TaxID=3641 RepID=A0A061ERW4_THECC|nr:Monovalent cation:proton antiporter-like protein [Theobroma cacao]